MKPIDAKSYMVLKIMTKILSLKLLIVQEDQNIKTFLKKATNQIGVKTILWLKKVKNTVAWTYVINDLKKKLLKSFLKKNCKRQIK